jgi:hypothetical protein
MKSFIYLALTLLAFVTAERLGSNAVLQYHKKRTIAIIPDGGNTKRNGKKS